MRVLTLRKKKDERGTMDFVQIGLRRVMALVALLLPPADDSLLVLAGGGGGVGSNQLGDNIVDSNASSGWDVCVRFGGSYARKRGDNGAWR
jgi:hypothetical protein